MKYIIALFWVLFLALSTTAQTPGQVGNVITIESTIPFQGYEETSAYLGRGEYQIYYDNIDGVLDNPLIVVDGFDAEDVSDTNSIFHYFTYGDPAINILEDLRDEGVDVIVLNFPNYIRPADGADINGGADYIERNGLVLINLIETIKSDMVGSQEIALIGPSMGGLVTRYALTYMEQHAIEHQSGLWISFDSPHRGANIPITLQYLINYVAELGGDADVVAMRDIRLNSVASKQMLLDHYTAHLLSGETIAQDYNIQLPTPVALYRNTFTTTMNALGFPTNTRNVSIVNGSRNGVMVESPGATLIDSALDLGNNLGLDIKMYFTPTASTTDFKVDILQPTYYGSPFGPVYETVASSPSYTSGLDSAPGGTVLFDDFFGTDATGILLQFQNALLLDNFSFIPVLSSLSIVENDWYNSIDGSETTPFDSYYTPLLNEKHLTMTNANAAFMWAELAAFFSVVSVEDFPTNKFKILENPVKETLKLQLNNQFTYDKLNVTIVTISGQQVSSYEYVNPSGVLEIPSPNTNGYYLIYLSDTKTTKVKKVIVQH